MTLFVDWGCDREGAGDVHQALARVLVRVQVRVVVVVGEANLSVVVGEVRRGKGVAAEAARGRRGGDAATFRGEDHRPTAVFAFGHRDERRAARCGSPAGFRPKSAGAMDDSACFS